MVRTFEKSAAGYDRFRFQQIARAAPPAMPVRRTLTPELLAQLKAQQGVPSVYRTPPAVQDAIQQARLQGERAARAAYGVGVPPSKR